MNADEFDDQTLQAEKELIEKESTASFMAAQRIRRRWFEALIRDMNEHQRGRGKSRHRRWKSPHKSKI